MDQNNGSSPENCSPGPEQLEKRNYYVVADSFTGLVRKRNEDSYVYAWDEDHRYLLAAVADGIGSTVNGDIAGNYMLQLLVQAWRNFQFPSEDPEQAVGKFLYDTVRTINSRLFEINSIGVCSDRDSLGTTISAAVFMENTMVAVNAGDSPIFRIRDGEIQKLNFDHNLANELVRLKQITESEAAALEQGRMLTRFIGPKSDVTPECYRFDVRTGDYFLLCSDGLTLHLSMEEIGQIVCEEQYLIDAMKVMFGKTIHRGAMDNATLVLLEAL